MNAKKPVLFLFAVALNLGGTANSQQNIGPQNPNPNRDNQDLETRQQLLDVNEKRRVEELRRHADQTTQAQVAKFMEAIKPRRRRFADFDQVVIHGQAPVTPEMLGLMAESPYAADIAYYLAKHPDESRAIAVMQTAEARQAVRQLEAKISAENTSRK